MPRNYRPNRPRSISGLARYPRRTLGIFVRDEREIPGPNETRSSVELTVNPLPEQIVLFWNGSSKLTPWGKELRARGILTRFAVFFRSCLAFARARDRERERTNES